jgi:hypothetical protein
LVDCKGLERRVAGQFEFRLPLRIKAMNPK